MRWIVARYDYSVVQVGGCVSDELLEWTIAQDIVVLVFFFFNETATTEIYTE